MTIDHVEKNVKKRKHGEDFLQYGFTSIITTQIEKLKCIICCEILSTKSMKLNKLKCPLVTSIRVLPARIATILEAKLMNPRTPDLTLG